MDWRREKIIDYFPRHSLQQIWESPKFIAARKLLFEKHRETMLPCSGCDYRSFRVGLIKDPLPNTNLSIEDLSNVANQIAEIPLLTD
jgi:hypothetical protein